MTEATGGILRPEAYQRRRETLQGWEVNIVSYKLGDRYVCSVDNVSPGALVARGDGPTREAAETRALDKARERLARTRRLPVEG